MVKKNQRKRQYLDVVHATRQCKSRCVERSEGPTVQPKSKRQRRILFDSAKDDELDKDETEDETEDDTDDTKDAEYNKDEEDNYSPKSTINQSGVFGCVNLLAAEATARKPKGQLDATVPSAKNRDNSEDNRNCDAKVKPVVARQKFKGEPAVVALTAKPDVSEDKHGNDDCDDDDCDDDDSDDESYKTEEELESEGKKFDAALCPTEQDNTNSKESKPTRKFGYAFAASKGNECTGWWNQEFVEWTDHARPKMKAIFKQDMCVGTLRNAEKAAADFASDVANSQNWIKFRNGRTATSNGMHNIRNIFDFQEAWYSLHPIIRTILKHHDPSPKVTQPKGWVQGNNSILSPNVSVTHNKHYDSRNAAEKLVLKNFGGEQRLRLAFTMTSPAGVHSGRTKETRYAFKRQDVLKITNGLFSFVVAGSFCNGKEAFFRSVDGTIDDDDKEGALLDFFCIDEESQDEDDSNGGEEQKMRHGVSNNAVAMSGMFECTVRADEMDEFINDLVNCYNNYVPKCAPESVPFRFPVTTNMFEKPGRNEKRHLATKRFENGYNMRTNWNDIVPGIRELLISWLAERTVALWEAYPKTTEDVNLAGKHCAFQGVAIGPQLMRWRHYLKHNISTPAWYADQSLKDRMDAIGLDISLSGFEANFLANCRKLKDFKVKNGGRNPRVRDPSEAVLTNF